MKGEKAKLTDDVVQFNRFMEANYNMMKKYCLSRVRNTYDAESITNDAFSRLWLKWEKQKSCSDDDNKKWIYAAIEIIIKEERRNAVKHFSYGIDDYADILHDTNTDDECIDKITYEEILNKILTSIKPQDAELFKMRYFEQMEYSEIEKRLNVTEVGLRVRFHRLKEKIKKFLK